MRGWLLIGTLSGVFSVVDCIIGRKPFMRGRFEISFSDSIGFPPIEEGEQRPGNAEEHENPVGQAEHWRPAE